MGDDHSSIILSILAYPRQVLGVPPNLMLYGFIGILLLAFLVGCVTGDLVQAEVLPLYVAVHMWLRRRYRADPHVEKVWTRRLWSGYPHGAPFAFLVYWRGTRNRMRRRRGTARFSV